MNGMEHSYAYAPHHQAQDHMHSGHQGQVPKSSNSDMSALEALVAVATSEDKVAAAY